MNNFPYGLSNLFIDSMNKGKLSTCSITSIAVIISNYSLDFDSSSTLINLYSN